MWNQIYICLMCLSHVTANTVYCNCNTSSPAVFRMEWKLTSSRPSRKPSTSARAMPSISFRLSWSAWRAKNWYVLAFVSHVNSVFFLFSDVDCSSERSVIQQKLKPSTKASKEVREKESFQLLPKWSSWSRDNWILLVIYSHTVWWSHCFVLFFTKNIDQISEAL